MRDRLTVDEYAAAIGELLADALSTGSETVGLADALGRVTAAPILSPVDLPLFRNSQMDGFAVVSTDLRRLPVSLPIVGEVAARPSDPPPLVAGTAVRIMTGAVVPDGSDAVVPIEDTTVSGATVTVHRGRMPGEYVRERSVDVREGDRLLPGGLRLAPRHLAVLAAAGLDRVEVRSRVRLVIVTTGAELVAPGGPAGLGEVYDSNGPALAAAAGLCGAQVTRLIRSAHDDATALRETLAAAAGDADLILTSGGVSMGDYEVVRELLEAEGGWVGHVAMQPGGPQAMGRLLGVPIVGFPGNPVSSQISFEVFVAPLLRQVAGLPAASRPTRRLTADVTSVAGKRQFLRGRLVDDGRVEVVSGPGSHLVAGLAASDVLIDIPADTTSLREGDTVGTWVL
ncbi:MAG TPA: gephyrin-like molybdotransferase Glp [Lacisediminihabitans sp.]|uniref:molybdopterin molybdotransferase MoeA n=1 Tax=Lacisediminihabitans sp. TaxID=2787631 RepID=UPI002ED8D543